MIPTLPRTRLLANALEFMAVPPIGQAEHALAERVFIGALLGNLLPIQKLCAENRHGDVTSGLPSGGSVTYRYRTLTRKCPICRAVVG